MKCHCGRSDAKKDAKLKAVTFEIYEFFDDINEPYCETDGRTTDAETRKMRTTTAAYVLREDTYLKCCRQLCRHEIVFFHDFSNDLKVAQF